MDSTIILEARELAADVHVANGDWQTILAKPIPLYEGDQISLKSAILDTVSKTTGTITIPEDQTLTVKGVPYIVDFARNNNPISDGTNAGGLPVPTNMAYATALTYDPDRTIYNRPDFGRYYLNQSLAVQTTSFRKLSFITFHPNGERYLDFKFTYTVTYKNAANVEVKDTHKLSSQPHHKSYTVYDINPIFNANVTDYKSPEFPHGGPYKVDIDSWGGHIYAKVSNTSSAPVATPTGGLGDSVITPFVAEATINLSKGIYTPDELCTVINRGLTANASGITNTLSRSNLFFGSDLLIGAPNESNFETDELPEGTGYVASNPPIFTFKPPPHGRPCVVRGNVGDGAVAGKIISLTVLDSGFGYSNDNKPTSPTVTSGNEGNNDFKPECETVENTSIFVNESPTDKNHVYTIKTGGGTGAMYIGASQVQLAYDQPTSKFVWKYLHTPMYSGAPPAETIQVANYLDSTGDGRYHYGVGGSISGITLTELSNGADANMNFWWDVLGFEPSILAKPTVFPTETQNLTTRGHYTRMFDPKTTPDPVGVAVTSAFVGNDAVYNKVTDKINWAVPSAKEFLSTVSADTTVGLAAAESTGDLDQDKSGYYLLDIDGIKQSAVGSDTTSSSLQAIVSRYYNSGSYTTGDSSMGVVYQHKGAPQYLQSLKIRVLQPNGELADDVGNDSAVFLQIDRAAPQPKKG